MSKLSSTRRRQLLQAAAVGAAVLASGLARASAGARARVVVVGGGWGGLGAARTLLEGRTVDVTLVEPNERFMSCPLSVHYITGHQPASDFQFGYDRLDQMGLRRVRERVQEIDRTRREVVTTTQRLPYDFLVLATGVEYAEESIQGYAEGREHLPVGFRAFEQSAVRRQVDDFLTNGGNFVISVPAPPFRCPPAPYERAFLIAEQMQLRRTKGKIVMIESNPGPRPLPIAQPILNGLQIYSKQIEYLTDTLIQSVDMGKRELTTGMGQVPFTHANLVLPMRAPALIRQAGLGERWAAVKLPSFQSQADEQIYVIGDSHGSPLPKSGQVAFGSGQQVGQEILLRAAGKTPVPTTGQVDLPTAICWGSVTQKEAFAINVASTFTPGQAPQLKFTVDPAHNRRSGDAALSWGASMWQALLG